MDRWERERPRGGRKEEETDCREKERRGDCRKRGNLDRRDRRRKTEERREGINRGNSGER